MMQAGALRWPTAHIFHQSLALGDVRTESVVGAIHGTWVPYGWARTDRSYKECNELPNRLSILPLDIRWHILKLTTRAQHIALVHLGASVGSYFNYVWDYLFRLHLLSYSGKMPTEITAASKSRFTTHNQHSASLAWIGKL